MLENGTGPLQLESIVGPYLAGVVGYVPANFNLLPWGAFSTSTDFTDSEYQTNQASLVTSQLGPDGSMGATFLQEDSSTNVHDVGTNFGTTLLKMGVTNPIPWTIAVIAKADTRTRIVVTWVNFPDSDSTASVGFDLAGGNTGYDNQAGANATILSSSMTSLGNGWWLCKFNYQYNYYTPGGTGLKWLPQINLDNGSGTAPRSISYTGDGTSGALLFWFNVLPAAAWTLSNQFFYDDFDNLSTIDLTNSKAPGFNWYVNNEFPGSFMPTFGWETNPPSAPTQASYLSISSPSVLKIYNPNNLQNGYTSQLWSVVSTGTSTVQGTTHKPPLCFDGYFSWDGLNADQNPHWTGRPTFWSVPIQALTGAGMSPTSNFLEWDVAEDTIEDGTFAQHTWSNPASPVDTSLGGRLYTLMSPGVFNRLSGIWLNPAATGTEWGIFLPFGNGRFVQNGDVAYSNNPAYGSQPGNMTGVITESDSRDFCIILNTGENNSTDGLGGHAMYIDWVKVYTQ